MNVKEIVALVIVLVLSISLVVLMFIVCLKTLNSEVDLRKIKIKELYKRMETFDTLQDFLNRF